MLHLESALISRLGPRVHDGIGVDSTGGVADSRSPKHELDAEDRVQRTWERTVKYYENLRVVFEIQTQLKEWTDQADSTDVKKEAK